MSIVAVRREIGRLWQVANVAPIYIRGTFFLFLSQLQSAIYNFDQMTPEQRQRVVDSYRDNVERLIEGGYRHVIEPLQRQLQELMNSVSETPSDEIIDWDEVLDEQYPSSEGTVSTIENNEWDWEGQAKRQRTDNEQTTGTSFFNFLSTNHV